MKKLLGLALIMVISLMTPAAASYSCNEENSAVVNYELLQRHFQSIASGLNLEEQSDFVLLPFSDLNLLEKHRLELRKLSTELAGLGLSISQANVEIFPKETATFENYRVVNIDKILTLYTADSMESPLWEFSQSYEVILGCDGVSDVTSLRPVGIATRFLQPVDNLSYQYGVKISRSTRLLPSENSPSGLTAEEKLKVAAYALKHAINYNPNYPAENGTDCTNFASQALRYGGWAKIGSGAYSQIDDYRYWGFYGSGIQALTWSTASWYRADGLFKHATVMTSRGWLRGKFNSNNVLPNAKSLLEPGDLIFVNWEGNEGGDIDHVMVVTSNANNQILISQHSNDRRNYRLLDSINHAAITTDWFLVTT